MKNSPTTINLLTKKLVVFLKKWLNKYCYHPSRWRARERTSHFSRTDAKSRWVYQIRTQLEQRYVACRDRETLIYLIFNEFIEHPTSRTSHMFVGFKLSVMRAVYLPCLSGSVLPATSISIFLPFTLNQLQYFRVMTRASACCVLPCK